MDQFFDLRRGHPWSLHEFCDSLHAARSETADYGVVAIQHWKSRRSDNWQHESLVLDVVPLSQGTDVPASANASHMFISIGRFGAKTNWSTYVWALADDQVVVLRPEHEATHATGDQLANPQQDDPYLDSDKLATLSWNRPNIPNLLDVFRLVTLLSLRYPRYTVYRHQCYWFARTIYDIFMACTGCTWGTTSNHWKRGTYVTKLVTIPVSIPEPPPDLRVFCDTQFRWNQLARDSQPGPEPQPQLHPQSNPEPNPEPRPQPEPNPDPESSN